MLLEAVSNDAQIKKQRPLRCAPLTELSFHIWFYLNRAIEEPGIAHGLMGHGHLSGWS